MVELYGSGSESMPTIGLGYALKYGGYDDRVSRMFVFHFLIEFTIGTDVNASSFCKAP